MERKRAAHGAALLYGRGRSVRRWLAALAVVLVGACSDSGTDPGDTPTLTLTLSGAALSVVQGQSGTVTVTIGRAGGFAGAVTLSLEGLPAGLTGAFAPASLGSTATTSTLTLTAGVGLAEGSHTVVVRAVGTGVTDKTATLAVTVTAAPAITVAANPTALTIAQGANAGTSVTITRTGGFAGAVDLTLEGAPAGVTGAFAPAQLGAGVTTSTLTVTVGAAVAPGQSTLTVRARGTGVTDKTAALTLTVSAPPAITLALSPTAVSVAQGANGTTGATITRTGGFAGAVNLTLEGAPTGVTGAFAPAQLGAGVTASTLTVTVGAGVAPGPYTLTVRAAGTGVTDRTATLNLTVTQSTPQGFTLSLEPAVLSVQQGASGTVKLTATRTGGFTGAITISAAGTVPGVTVGLPSNTLALDTMTLTISVAALGSAGGTPLPGTLNLTLSGQATGLTTQNLTLPLTVTASPGGFGLTVSPAAVSVQAGAGGRAAVRINRTGGYTGSVTLAVTGAPTGLTPTLATTTTTEDSVELTLATTAAVTPGTYPLTVRGSVAGLADQTTTLNVTVTAAPTPAFTLALAPTSLSVQQGANATSALTITRTGGFTGPITLSLSGAPAGLTVTLDSTTVGGTGTTVRVAAAAGLATGNYNVTVQGTGSGVAAQSVTLAVTVTSGSTGGNVTLSFCANDIPLFVAAQSGTGAWVRVTGTGGQFSFNISGKGGIAYVDDGNELNVFYGTEDELRGFGGSQCISDDPPTGKTLTGTVAGLGQTELANITLGPSVGSVNSFLSSYTLNNVPDGALDLIASRMNFNLVSGNISVNKFIVRRGLNLPNNSIIPVLDFNAAEAFNPATPTLTINNLGADSAYLSLSYVTGSTLASVRFGTGAFYFAGLQPATGTYPGMPAANQQAADLHFMVLVAGGTADTVPSRFRLSYFKLAANQTVTLGPNLSTPTITVLGTSPNLLLRAQVPVQMQYDDVMTVNYGQTNRGANITATAGYFGAGFSTWDLVVPDLSGIGFDPAWGLAQALTNWDLSAVSYTGIIPSLNPQAAEGVTVEAATRGGKITP